MYEYSFRNLNFFVMTQVCKNTLCPIFMKRGPHLPPVAGPLTYATHLNAVLLPPLVTYLNWVPTNSVPAFHDWPIDTILEEQIEFSADKTVKKINHASIKLLTILPICRVSTIQRVQLTLTRHYLVYSLRQHFKQLRRQLAHLSRNIKFLLNISAGQRVAAEAVFKSTVCSATPKVTTKPINRQLGNSSMNSFV